MFTGYLFKQGNYLPIGLADFQPLIHHTGMLYTIMHCHGDLGAGGEVEKTAKCFRVAEVRDSTRPYSTMRARAEQAPVVRLHALCFVSVSFSLLW